MLPYKQKLNLKKQCFYRNIVQYQKLQQMFEVQSFGLDTAHSCVATHLLLCRCSLFGISPGASGVLSRYFLSFFQLMTQLQYIEDSEPVVHRSRDRWCAVQ